MSTVVGLSVLLVLVILKVMGYLEHDIEIGRG